MNNKQLYLPALQGHFGTWTYYTALVSLKDLSERVGYASELQENPSLDEEIQRVLNDKTRTQEISDYLIDNEERFFSSLVVGVFQGYPQWYPFSVSSKAAAHTLDKVVEDTQQLIGYLELRGDEQLFALDGQHRLAGIKRAIKEKPDLAEEKLSVIFVAHAASDAGLKRTRNLFVSLNKKAVPVGKRDIIVLDEVDLAAIITRKLVSEHDWFKDGQIDVRAFTTNINPKSNALTSISNFYDIISIVIKNIAGRDAALKAELKRAEKQRLNDDRIDYYSTQVVEFFKRLSAADSLLAKILSKNDTEALQKARGDGGQHILARPLGIKLAAMIVSKLREENSIAKSFDLFKMLPLDMAKPPYLNTVWDNTRRRMIPSGARLAEQTALYMLGIKAADAGLKERLAKAYGDESGKFKLPAKLV